MLRSVLLIVLLCVTFTNAHAKRVALVIGNDNYQNVSKLKKAVNDAKAVAKAMRQIGFQVIDQINADRRQMDEQLEHLSSSINQGDEILFFFAGHGISVKGQNYLLPTDIPKIKPGQERRVTKEAFSEDEIIDILRERGAKVSILIIDACRNNPFPKKGTRSIGLTRGLGQRSTPPRNTFVMYSAGIGEEALDRLSENDDNPNSIFTRLLLPLLKTPGLSHLQMAKQLQIEVEQLAMTTQDKHQQFPAFYDQVRGNYFLVPGQYKGKMSTNTPHQNADETLWHEIKDSKKQSDFEFYLKEYPKGRHVSVARLKLDQIIKNLKNANIYIAIIEAQLDRDQIELVDSFLQKNHAQKLRDRDFKIQRLPIAGISSVIYNLYVNSSNKNEAQTWCKRLQFIKDHLGRTVRCYINKFTQKAFEEIQEY